LNGMGASDGIPADGLAGGGAAGTDAGIDNTPAPFGTGTDAISGGSTLTGATGSFGGDRPFSGGGDRPFSGGGERPFDPPGDRPFE